MKFNRPIRVLIVDDSIAIQKILAEGMRHDPQLVVVGQASDPYQARDMLVELQPDVITLDVEMPRMDGVTFLKRFMPVMPIPTVIISTFTQQGQRITIEALEAGAVDVIGKPSGGLEALGKQLKDINKRVKLAAEVDVSKFKHRQRREVEVVTSHGNHRDKVIAIGASTGGVEALNRILPAFPANTPGIVLVQHMPAGFTATFSSRLNSMCNMKVKEAEDGDIVKEGLMLIAPGGSRHMSIAKMGDGYRVLLTEGEEVNYSRPAVDVLFNSVAKVVGSNAAAAILTGMGKDGAEGLLAIRRAGGRTMVQDEATSVVYGMPKVAYDIGGAEKCVPLEKIPYMLVRALQE